MHLKKHVFLLSSLFFLFALGITAAVYLTSPESALPVNVILIGNGLGSVETISVSRLSVNGTVKPLVSISQSRTQTTFSDVAQQVYYKGIRISLTNKQLESIQAVDVTVGESTSRYNKRELLQTWSQHVANDSTKTFDYTTATADKRILGRPLPVLNIDISYRSFWAILINRLPLLILLLFVGCNIKDRFPAGYIHSKAHKPLLLAVAVTVGLLIYKLPFSVQPIGYGLDPSWITALNWAQYKGLSWGEDLAFTYGPYFWLLYPGIVASQTSLIIAFLITTVVYGYAIGTVVYYLLRSFLCGELSLTVMGASLLILLFFEFTLTDVAILVPVLILSEEEYRYNKSFPVYILMAILALCKFSYLPVSACIVVFVSIRLLLQRKWLSSVLNVGTFIGSIVVLWWASGQPVENLGLFLKRGYQVASGYSEAMATPFWNSDQSLSGNLLVNVALLLWGVLFIVGALILFGKVCLNGKDWFKIFLTSPILFLAFKEGYVRMDFAHSKLFFSQLVLVLIAYALLLRKNRFLLNELTGLISLLVLFSLLFVDASHPVPYAASLKPTFNRIDKEEAFVTSRRNTVSHYQLSPKLVGSIGADRVDIIPYDISLLYAYGFNWAARPVFQSYSAYTSSLDSINAAYNRSSRAPASLLVSFSSIDNRYPLFDEPMLLRTMRTNYQVAASYQNRFLLLHQLKNPKSEHSVLSQRRVEQLNAVVHIPTMAYCYTYMYADLQLTTLGKLCNFLLKVQPPYLEIETDGMNQSRRYRLIRQTANDGLLISHIAENIQSVALILSGKSINNARSVRIIGNPMLYKSDITVIFKITRTDQ